jgi:hypothetical protein
MKIFNFLFLFLFFSFRLKAEKNHFRKIKTDHFDIVYRDDFEDRAQIMANIMEYLYEIMSKDSEKKSFRSFVFFDNESLNSNGTTILYDFYLNTFPPSNPEFIAGHDWIIFLISHEMRHAFQHYAEMKNFIKLSYIYGGNVMKGNLNNFFSYIPAWFYEGDAVCKETSISHYGRLSYPSYLMNTKSIMENSNINYMQAFYRSKNSQLPSLYQLGTMMVFYMKIKYGKDIVDKIFFETSKSILPFSFYIAVKKLTGKHVHEIYEDMRKYFLDIWSIQNLNIKETKSEVLNKSHKYVFMDYFYPQFFENENIIALKVDKNNNYEIVEIKNFKEKRLYNPYKIVKNTRISSSKKNCIVWLEPRSTLFSKNNYINIMMLKKNKDKFSIHPLISGRFTDVGISSNEEKIVAIESSPSYHHSLKLIDIKSKKVEKIFENKKNRFYINASLNQDATKIVYTVSEKEKISLEIIDIESEKIDVLIDSTYENINNPIFCGDYIFYCSPFSGINSIYAININSKKIFQVVSKRYGAFTPCINEEKNKILFANYENDGLNVEMSLYDEKNWIEIENIIDKNTNIEKDLRRLENVYIDYEKIPNIKYKSKRHYLIKDIFNPSSWMIQIYPINLTSIFDSSKKDFDISLNPVLIFKDIYSTFEQIYDLEYFFLKKILELKISLNILKTFPKIGLEINAKKNFKNEEEKKFIKLNFSFPINFPIKNIHSNLFPSFSINYGKDSSNKNIEKDLFEIVSYPLSYNFFFMSFFDYPTLGKYITYCNRYSFGFFYRYIDNFFKIKKTNYRSGNTIWGINSKIYLPGFFYSDVFIFKNIFQRKNIPHYYQKKDLEFDLINQIPENVDFVKKLKYFITENYTGNLFGSRLAYAFPIIHPDIGINYLVFLETISMTLYIEYINLPDSNFFINEKLIKNIFTFGIDLYICSWPFLQNYSNYEEKYSNRLDIKLAYAFCPSSFYLAEHSRHKNRETIEKNHRFSVIIKWNKFKKYNNIYA